MIYRSFNLICGILLFAQFCAGQDGLETNIDHYVRSEMLAQHIPGLSLAVMENGKIALAKGYGLANVELEVPVTAETVFQSGSVGKQFTATAVMMLVEDRKLGLDDQLTKFFTNAPDSWTNVTIRGLLSHTGGFSDFPKDFDFHRDYTEDELLKRAEAIPLAYPPGEKWSYSNLGYVTLGILIHKVSGEFYGDVLQKRIFRPLGMKTARIVGEEDIVPNRAAGYRLVDGELRNQQWFSRTMNMTADGGCLLLSVLDMAKWDAALYTTNLLSKSSLEEMWTPVRLTLRLKDGTTGYYGFGWGVRDYQGRRLIQHGGHWQGFSANISRYPDDKLTVVVFANLAHSDPGKIAHHIAALYNPELAPSAAEKPEGAGTLAKPNP
jgi:CubicO group peptidase (beta-lactamase class C family)